ncbi:MerR family transcriptional regulator [Brevibacterium casei]|uniref:MerR family transcriptional regulator n=1 Tax=Brevibacterium casei S18 TaxID=1229781 RepID=K9B0Q8_9MICO|nr:MerR family transcriptional regulator [Brevibacterium casei]EKU47365.1 MerR family transcriptional regulator [Brevibacterium casei S18]MBE4694055.1 MerR family transcriptional regulator [Brevibacterium casei]MBY3577178.1 MerR family transcriptional regulator [Brevibacterium casei]NJE66606.1 MerR family transcriptional regulator [Brevibacterium sp. LS14]
MRISELSRRSDVPVATIKYYLREGLLPAGERTSATQAVYTEAHVNRLELIRALLGPARLSIEKAKRVLGVIDDPPDTFIGVLGAAQEATAQEPADAPDDGPALALIAELGWSVDPESVEVRQLASALRAVEAGGVEVLDGGLARYGRTIHDLAEAEVATVPTDEIDGAVRQAVLGTLLLEPVLLALRRLAQQDVATRRFRDADSGAEG